MPKPQPATPPTYPGTPAEQKGVMLPGVAILVVFLLILTLLNVYGAVAGAFGAGPVKYGVLALCTLLVAGLLGLLRMTRWGYSIVLAGCLLLSASYFYVFSRTHQTFSLVQGFFMLIFFLYLVRPEVRDRMR